MCCAGLTQEMCGFWDGVITHTDPCQAVFFTKLFQFTWKVFPPMCWLRWIGCGQHRWWDIKCHCLPWPSEAALYLDQVPRKVLLFHEILKIKSEITANEWGERNIYKCAGRLSKYLLSASFVLLSIMTGKHAGKVYQAYYARAYRVISDIWSMEVDLHVSEIAFVNYYFDASVRAAERLTQAEHGQKQMMIWGLVIIWFQSILQGFSQVWDKHVWQDWDFSNQRFSGEKMKTDFTCIRAIAAGTTLFNLSLYGFGRI